MDDMTRPDVAAQALEQLGRLGFDKAQVQFINSERHEIEAQRQEPSLFRTTHDVQLELTGIVNDRRGRLSLNQTDPGSLAAAAEQLKSIVLASPADPANDIAAMQPAAHMERGRTAPERDLMMERLVDCLTYGREHYPTVFIGQMLVAFEQSHGLLLNSNGVEFKTRRSEYQVQLMLAARDGSRASSFSATGFAGDSLDRPLQQCANVDRLMRETAEQIDTRPVPGAFEGQLLVAPACVESFAGFLTSSISSGPMVSNTSVYRGKLGEAVASELLTLDASPVQRPGGYFVTPDGFAATDVRVLDGGVLASYLLDLYGANKTGFARSGNVGGGFVVAAGTTPLEEMVAGIDKGILINRFSGGTPSSNGDVAGIAKNSYYIEGGRVRYPVSETMIRMNIPTFLRSITAVSRDSIDFGSSAAPWLLGPGVGVS